MQNIKTFESKPRRYGVPTERIEELLDELNRIIKQEDGRVRQHMPNYSDSVLSVRIPKQDTSIPYDRVCTWDDARSKGYYEGELGLKVQILTDALSDTKNPGSLTKTYAELRIEDGVAVIETTKQDRLLINPTAVEQAILKYAI